MCAQCDADGNDYLLQDAVFDYYSSDKALNLDWQKIVVNIKTLTCCSTTRQKLFCPWKVGSTSWEQLKDIMESHPVKVAEYIVAQNIGHEPAFNYQVNHVLRKKDQDFALIQKCNIWHLKKTYKFDIELPKTMRKSWKL